MIPSDSSERAPSGSGLAELAGRVLVVEDDPLVRHAVTRILRAAGHTLVEAADARDARACIESGQIDVALIDLRLPDGNGLELLPALTQNNPHVSVIVMTGSEQRSTMLEALRLGATAYLRKPLDALALEAQVVVSLAAARSASSRRSERERLDEELANAQTALAAIPTQLAVHLTGAWDLRHVETGAHVRRIAEFTAILARALGASPHRAAELAHAARLHDVGKIMIPDAILTKPGPLTPEEFETMKAHTVLGARMLDGISHPLVRLAHDVALWHHERWDGSGYPHGLVGEQCPWEARVVAIVDVYDALSQPRCYKPAWEEQQVIAHFESNSGRLYESPLVATLLDSLPELRALRRAFPDSATWPAAQPVS